MVFSDIPLSYAFFIFLNLLRFQTVVYSKHSFDFWVMFRKMAT